jgi:hypothetical protein
MSPQSKAEIEDDLLPEYDFTGAVRGKYYDSYRRGTNVVLLDPDIAEVFRDAKAVNDALRLLVSVAEAKVPGHRTAASLEERPGKHRQPPRVTSRIRSTSGPKSRRRG